MSKSTATKKAPVKKADDDAPFDADETKDVGAVNQELKPVPKFNDIIESELKKYDTVVPAIEELKKNLCP